MINTIFQFCIPTNPGSFRKIFQEEQNPKVILVFDLEDGVQNVPEPQHTATLKKSVRNDIATLLNHYPKNGSACMTGIRINSITSTEFTEDILFLKRIGSKAIWKNIFLPKIKSHREILSYITTFNENNIAFEEVIPVVETAEGYANISSIFKSPAEARLKRGVWGNHDFNLDCGYWPFQDVDSQLYWERIKVFISCLKKMSYEFVNSPILELDNKELSIAVFNEINSLCKSGFSQVALSYKQAIFFSTWKAEKASPNKSFLQSSPLNREEKINLAKKTIEQYNTCHLSGKSFSIIERHKRIISPQEFTAAQNFLNENS